MERDYDYGAVIRFANGIAQGFSREDFVELQMLKTPSDEENYALALERTDDYAGVVPDAEVEMGSYSEETLALLQSEGLLLD